ncbi:MAG: dGTPase [Verrucomicrobia bacterium]|jgi:dGTPase|nr:MAG: dGTPase [Verrucomicrobiota bacterium]
MENLFYSGFDTESLDPRPQRLQEYRSPFQIDRDRIIHSSAFRALQSKTQVFLSGEYDFYRTRLTHSMEVAQIGRSICAFLNSRSSLLHPEFSLDPDLVEAACLAHDLGHPPYGHRGERTLNRLMRPWGGFEGNAQTLRLLTETIFEYGGMNPSRGLLDGILKYKTLRAELSNPERHFIYNDQDRYLDFVLAGRDFPAGFTPGKARNGFRSIECQIMDWADDTAYSLHDIIDGIQAAFITQDRLERWAAAQPDQDTVAPVVAMIIKNIREQKLESRAGRRIGDFITACSLVEDPGFMSPTTNRHRFRLRIDDAIQTECQVYKRIATSLVYGSHQLQQLDHRADFILSRLFDALAETYIEPSQPGGDHMPIVPPALEQRIWNAGNETARARLICDHLASLTDVSATRTYKRLFDANFGSITDLV